MDEEFDTYETADADMDYSSSDDTSYDTTDYAADGAFDNSDYSEDTSNDIDYETPDYSDNSFESNLNDSGFDVSEDSFETDSSDFTEETDMDTDSFEEDTTDNTEGFDDSYLNEDTEYDDGGDPKILTRDEHELLSSGYHGVEQQLEVLEDDYRDKGFSDEEIEERLADDRYRLQQEFLNDAFPGQEVSPHVFNGFRENGAQDMMSDIENYDSVRERLTSDGTESSAGESDFEVFEEDTSDDYMDAYEESIDGDDEIYDFPEDTEEDIGDETLDGTFDNGEDFIEDTYEENDEGNNPEHSEQIYETLDENNPEHSEQTDTEGYEALDETGLGTDADENYEALDETGLETDPLEENGLPSPDLNEDGAVEAGVIEESFEITDDAVVSEDISNEPIDLDNIDYDSIYEGIEADALAEGFKDVNLDTDTERLNDSLSNFDSDTWENLSLDDQKNSMQNLADYVSDITGLENPPKIEYYNNEVEGDFGGYDPSTNTLQVNEYMLYNSDEAADTIAHELWHAHQHERAMNPQSALDFQYQHNFDNYISPDLDQQAYEDQLVEAEARAFANQFKDRLKAMKGM